MIGISSPEVSAFERFLFLDGALFGCFENMLVGLLCSDSIEQAGLELFEARVGDGEWGFFLRLSVRFSSHV